jgi:N-acetylglutamate synthase-like GNAT family acetyltransferase
VSELAFSEIPHGSFDYKQAVELREKILRRPLGLSFSEKELSDEHEHLHIGGFINGVLVATCMLVRHGEIMQMRRVAVDADLQGTGIGSQMLTFCEIYAKDQGFKEMFAHARETAIAFYRKNHYLPEGDLFDEVGIPHLHMRKRL